MKNMAVAVIDRLFIVVYGAASPTDEEWAAYLELVERHGVDETMQLIVTDGGGPTAPQRLRLNEVLDGRTVPVAVVSGSVRVRGTVATLALFNRKIKAFSPAGLYDAIEYLEIPTTRAELLEHELGKLRRELDADQGERTTRPPPSA